MDVNAATMYNSSKQNGFANKSGRYYVMLVIKKSEYFLLKWLKFQTGTKLNTPPPKKETQPKPSKYRK